MILSIQYICVPEGNQCALYSGQYGEFSPMQTVVNLSWVIYIDRFGSYDSLRSGVGTLAQYLGFSKCL